MLKFRFSLTFFLPHLQTQITQVRLVQQGLNTLPPVAYKASGTAFTKVFTAWQVINLHS